MRKKPIELLNVSELQREAIKMGNRKEIPSPAAPEKDEQTLRSLEAMANQVVEIAKRSDETMALGIKIMKEAILTLSQPKKEIRAWKFKVKKIGSDRMEIKAKAR